MGISFNGGKDCTVLLYLVALCLYGRNPNLYGNTPIATVYVERSDSFPEVEQFVDVIEKKQLAVLLSLERIKGSMKDALFQFVDRHPAIGAVFVGVRKGDPFSGKITDDPHYRFV